MRQMLDPALAALLRGLKGALAESFVLVEGSSRAWAIGTFEGARHRLTLRFADAAAAERVAAILPELDLPLRGHLVAEIAELALAGEELTFSALTVIDA